MIQKPNVCVAGVDSFFALNLCKYLATKYSHYMQKISCCYNQEVPEEIDALAVEPSINCFPYSNANLEQLQSCFKNVDTVIICPPFTENVTSWVEKCIEACCRSGVKNVLFWSWLGCEQSNSSGGFEWLPQIWQCEKICRAKFANCSIFRYFHRTKFQSRVHAAVAAFLGNGYRQAQYAASAMFSHCRLMWVCPC